MEEVPAQSSPKRPPAPAAADSTPPLSNQVRTVNLALQGGGAHGAFTWGVLDRLLEEENLGFEGISGTSAGAMNAAVLAYGLALGGHQGARRALTEYWKRISEAAAQGPLQPSPMSKLLQDYNLFWSPIFTWVGVLTRAVSPYELNPLDFNPLRDVVEQSVNFDVLKRPDCPVKLFLSATNVRTGKVKVFSRNELSVPAVMASACLPQMFRAVEIDGEAYWDGGYMGNPTLYPLIYDCQSADIVIIHINPLFRSEVPHTAGEIMNRVNEISFNSSLMREMRAVSFVTRLIMERKINDPSMKHVLIHSISDDEFMTKLTQESKYNADWDFLNYLRDEGRKCGAEWLERNFDKLGVETTVDIDKIYL